jgi:hypothetical protein
MHIMCDVCEAPIMGQVTVVQFDKHEPDLVCGHCSINIEDNPGAKVLGSVNKVFYRFVGQNKTYVAVWAAGGDSHRTYSVERFQQFKREAEHLGILIQENEI